MYEDSLSLFAVHWGSKASLPNPPDSNEISLRLVIGPCWYSIKFKLANQDSEVQHFPEEEEEEEPEK